MSRYLTPSKVSLLALAWLYSTASNSNSGFEEFALPSNPRILSFIMSHILSGASAIVPGGIAPQLSDFEKVLKKTGGGLWPGKSGWDIFLEKLWKDFQCLDDLYNFFRFLPHDVFEPSTGEDMQIRIDNELGRRPSRRDLVIARVSPLGVFIRRACLEFTRLQFDDIVKLWETFKRYRASTEAAWRRRNPTTQSPRLSDSLIDSGRKIESDLLYEKAYGHLQDPTTAEAASSIEDVERLLDYQIERLQSTLRSLRYYHVLTRKRIWEQSFRRDERTVPSNGWPWHFCSKLISLCEVRDECTAT